MVRSKITYKEFYNKDRGLPEPIWGDRAEDLQCPWCGSQDMYFSGSPDDPEEIFGAAGDVRCKHCGHISDWYEAHKQRVFHPGEAIREVIGRP